MGSLTVSLDRRALGAATLAEAFRLTVEQFPDQVAVRTKDDEISLTWAQLRDRVDALAGGLARLGVRRSDPVALMLTNRPEFHIADLAAMTLGATPFSVYTTSSPEQIAYVLDDAGATVMIAEAAFLPRILVARGLLPHLEQVILLEGADEPGMTAWADVEGADPGFDPEPHWRAVGPHDLLTLIYTSGTTGPPKGVELTHRNLLAELPGVQEIVDFPPDSRVISWLPSAHIAERAAHHYLPILYGMTVTDCPNPRDIVTYLPAVRPSWFFAVPRIWEKLKSGLDAFLGAGDDAARNQAWLAAAREKVELEQRGEKVPDALAATVDEADAQLFAGLRAMLGLDQLVAVNVGAAPTPHEVLVFFHSIGIPLAELWGMSETTGTGLVNPPARVKIGTVGPPLAGVEVKTAADGELLVRGEIVMRGYRNQPERTAEAIDEEGWLHTGDIAQIDDDGYVRIVDRKKELIINAAGKNMSPSNIESALKGASPLIGQAVVIGDARAYNTALIVLDADFAPAWAAQNGLAGMGLAELAGEQAMRQAVQAGVDAANARLSRVEQIKRFAIMRGDWAPGGDELTPTMKLKRRPIERKYAAEIDGMYAAQPPA